MTRRLVGAVVLLGIALTIMAAAPSASAQVPRQTKYCGPWHQDWNVSQAGWWYFWWWRWCYNPSIQGGFYVDWAGWQWASATLPPNAAFNQLLPTVQQMTTAPMMLPASLPGEIKNVAIEQDPNENPYTTGGEQYTILFLSAMSNPNQIVMPYAHYMTFGRLTSSPTSSAPLLDPTNGLGTLYQLGEVALPDGTVATLEILESPSGANYGPFTVGTYEEKGQRYTVMMENDTPEGEMTSEILSTMVKAPSA